MFTLPIYRKYYHSHCTYVYVLAMKSLPVGTTWILLKLYRTILACGLTASYPTFTTRPINRVTDACNNDVSTLLV